MTKRLVVVRLYLAGVSYGEIAGEVGVSKGSVANVVADLKAGRVLQAGDVGEQIELWRELAVDLKRLGLTAGDAVAGTSVLSHLRNLEIEACDIGRWASACKAIMADGPEGKGFVQAALGIAQVQERTGLEPEVIEKRVRALEQEASRLAPLVEEGKGIDAEIKDLQERRLPLSTEVEELEEHRDHLKEGVDRLEQRETQLSVRVHELEERAHDADTRVATARTDLQGLATLGLPIEALTGFGQRLKAIAQR